MLAGDVNAPRVGTGCKARDLLILTVKATVTAACFWYIFRQIQLDRFVHSAKGLLFGWVIFAVLAEWIQILLVAVRWSTIVNALSEADRRMSIATAAAITMAGAFFGQVLPYVAGDGARAWFLVQHGHDWRTSLLSVLIDRAVGVGMLCALSFIILLLPAAALSLGAHRAPALQAFGVTLALGVTGLLAAPWLAPRLERWTLPAGFHRSPWRRIAPFSVHTTPPSFWLSVASFTRCQCWRYGHSARRRGSRCRRSMSPSSSS